MCSSSSRSRRSRRHWSREAAQALRLDQMTTSRMRKVNEALREILAEAISSDMKDPRIGFVTITQVDTAPDLRAAKVYVSVLGSEEDRAETLAGLESAQGFLQSRIGGEMQIKRTPTLSFHYDDTIERGDRISRLLED